MGNEIAYKNYSDTWENILSYNFTIAKDHDFGLTGVTSWQKNTNEYTYAEGSGQDLDVWKYWRLLAANSQRVESGLTATQKMSYAVRFNYSYRGKNLFTFSNRWDGVTILIWRRPILTLRSTSSQSMR